MNLMLQEKKPLNRLKIGETAQVSDLLSVGSMRRRLLDMGLVEGTRVECVQKSPAGDPAAYRFAALLLPFALKILLKFLYS